METKGRKLWQLFVITLTLSAFTFGGGYAIVSFMKKKFADELGLLTEDEILDMVAIAQTSPGPVAVNVSLQVGYRLVGILGALVAILGTVLPPLVAMTLVAYVYGLVFQIPLVRAIMGGLMVGVAIIILDVAIDMAAKIIKSKSVLGIVVLALALVAMLLLKISGVWVLLTSGVCGLLVYLLASKKREGKDDQ